MKLLILLLTGSILQISLSQDVNFETLKLVQVMFRHGERVPEKPYPTDPYSNGSIWKVGWGQLTDTGKRQAFDLGVYLRDRYQDFISESYIPDEIYAQSSDLDRTIMSAQLCLAGMFPAENGTEWNADLPWQPVPLRTIATENDNRIRFKRICPKYDADFEDFIYNSPGMKEINTKNKDLFELLANKSGTPIRNIDDIDDFYATMMVEEMLGLAVPEWAMPIVHTDNFQYLYNLSFASATATPEFKRLRTGPLVQYLVNNIKTRVSNSSMTTKFFMLSGHDTTLVAILNTLGVLDLQRPFYSSALMLELHQDTLSNDFYVRLVYRNDTSRLPYELAIPGCDAYCPLNKFLDYTRPIIPENWESECNLGDSSSLLYFLAVAATGILILGFLSYLLYLLVQTFRRREAMRGDYQTL